MSTTINKNLGHVTAYAYAKAGGYTGTEAEFQALLGNIAIDLSEIENLTVVVNTLPAGSSATSSYSDGVLTLGIPRGDTGEVSDADLAEALEDYVEKTMLDDYAQVDGYYQEMTVGDAEQLVATTFTEDDAPYNFRTAGGAIDIGDRKHVEGIVGGSIAWNQLLNDTYEGDGVSILSITKSGDVVNAEIVDTFEAGWQIGIHTTRLVDCIKDHKYLIAVDAYLPHNGVLVVRSPQMLNGNEYSSTIQANTWTSVAMIKNGYSTATGARPYLYPNNSADYSVGDVMKYRNFMIFDLTQMFGSTIADYIYNLEQANAGAGVAWFKKLFPKPYYAYNAGELMSVKALRHITRGFNAFDKSTATLNKFITAEGTIANDSVCFVSDYIKVVPNATYYCNHISGTAYHTNAYCLYDESKNLVGYGSSGVGYENAISITMGSDVHYIRFNGLKSQIDATNFNLSWDGERDGEYEEYAEHVYELDPDLELRGVPKLSAGNDLYYDGDMYEPDGTVTRKYGVVDLGTLNWTRLQTQGDVYRFRTQLSSVGKCADTAIANMICPKYKAITPRQSYDGSAVGISGYFEGGYIFVQDPSYTDASSFKSAMNGVMLVYELATPTTEEADPYNGTQIVDDFGTEEFVDAGVEAGDRDIAIPVGHNSLYQPNLRAKLEMAPEAPEDEGYYVVYHHDGINEYVPLIIPQELPELPTEDGTYTLKATVSGGTPTYIWEAEE